MLQIGKVLKSNGVDGGLLVSFREIEPEDINIEEPVFIYFDGLPVPFFIQSISRKGTDKAIVHLNDINNLEDAEEVVGQGVYMDDSLFEDEEEELDYSDLIGWTLLGADGAVIGPVTDFIDIPSNPCIEVAASGGAAIIPLHEDLILSFDENRQELTMEIPDGLLEL